MWIRAAGEQLAWVYTRCVSQQGTTKVEQWMENRVAREGVLTAWTRQAPHLEDVALLELPRLFGSFRLEAACAAAGGKEPLVCELCRAQRVIPEPLSMFHAPAQLFVRDSARARARAALELCVRRGRDAGAQDGLRACTLPQPVDRVACDTQPTGLDSRGHNDMYALVNQPAGLCMSS
jgi:hypothetical protein